MVLRQGRLGMPRSWMINADRAGALALREPRRRGRLSGHRASERDVHLDPRRRASPSHTRRPADKPTPINLTNHVLFQLGRQRPRARAHPHAPRPLLHRARRQSSTHWTHFAGRWHPPRLCQTVRYRRAESGRSRISAATTTTMCSTMGAGLSQD